MDISSAFLQTQGFDREVYVKLAKEVDYPSSLWKLTAAVFGLVNSATLWYCTNYHALVDEKNLTKSRYEPSLYCKDEDGTLACPFET